MKKIFLSVCTLILFATFANAQKSGGGGFHLGAKLGANLGKVDGQSFSQGFNLGFQAGGFAEIDFNKSIGIQPEVLFSQTKTKYDTSFGQVLKLSNGQDVTLDYLSIPVLLRINASKLLTFNLGPQYSILMNKHETLLQNGKDAFKSGDLSFAAGAQVNLGSLRVYGRYNVGLSNIGDIGNQDKWKNQQIQLGIGLKIL